MQLLAPGSLKKTGVSDDEAEFIAQIMQFRDDPLGFVRTVFHWGHGSLANEEGPDKWQVQFLTRLGELIKESGDEAAAIRMAVASGHGVGKTTMVAWIIYWFISTRENPQIVVTANTQAQLSSKTWRELSKWHKLAFNRHWFEWTATRLTHVLSPSDWYASAIPWSEHNSEAFAGTHEKHVLVIFDEASAIADSIWDVVEGAMTTPGAMWLCFGNPTRNMGRFADCFSRHRHRWHHYRVDSRDAKVANKAQIQQWIEDYGEDSDFVRVRVRGEFPRQSATQFIAGEAVMAAMKLAIDPRSVQHLRPVIGVDVARYGDDQSVILVRQGNYVHPPYKFRGLDTMELAAKVADVYQKFGPSSVACVDGVGIGAGVVDRLRMLGLNVIDVQSAAKSLDVRTYRNKRSELYGRVKDWLLGGGCLPNDNDFYDQLSALEFSLTNSLQIQLASKDDIRSDTGRSPDVADALAYTFAYDEMSNIAFHQRRRPIKKVNWI